MKNKFTYFLFISIFILSGCTATVRTVSPQKTKVILGGGKNIPADTVRVLLSEEISSFQYRVDIPVDLYADGIKIAMIKKGNLIDLKRAGTELTCRIQRKTFRANSFKVSLAGEGFLTFKKSRYRGLFEFIASASGIMLVNHVTMNDYLRGVLPYELPTKNDKSYFQGLKAFAITARTYTVIKTDKRNQYFDLFPDTRDQVYGGADRETEMDSVAIAETEGMLIYYNNEPAQVLYHGACGGSTEAARHVFQNDYPYLIPVKDGDPPNCSISPTFGWQEVYSGEEISKFFFNTKFFMEEKAISDIEILSRLSSGRVSKLRISFKTGEQITLDQREIRQVFRQKKNNGILRSLLFDIQKDFKNDVLAKLIITGKGSGHGVGLCQWGALGMSKEGADYKEIIQHYFPSTVIQIKYD